MGRANGVDQHRRRRFGNVATGRDDHRVGVGQRLQAVPDTGLGPAADLGIVLAAAGEAYRSGASSRSHPRPRRRGEFEQQGAVGGGQGDRGHVETFRDTSLRTLAGLVDRATFGTMNERVAVMGAGGHTGSFVVAELGGGA